MNRPGGHGKITHVHVAPDGIVTLDIKYIVGIGSDARVDVVHVRPYQEPTSRGVRSRRHVVSPETTVPMKEDYNNKENAQTTKELQPSRPESLPKQEKKKKKTKHNKSTEPSKRAAMSLPKMLRPKKKKATTKEGRKRPSVDPTETMSEGDPVAPKTHHSGVPREIACENMTFFSPLNDYSRLSSSCNRRKLDEQEDVFQDDDDSMSSFGDKEEDYVQHTENGVTTIVASAAAAKSPISRTKPLIRGDLPNVESLRVAQPKTKLERIQQAQVSVAKKFVDEVVQHTSAEPPARLEETSEREDHFCASLYYALDMNDSLIQEDDLLRLVNERMNDGPPFEDDEIGVYMESLISKNRIMKADGVVVLI